MEQIRLLAFVVVITVTALPVPASAWNIPGHMLSGIIAYSGPSAREPPDHREGKSSAGETSLVREPMAGEASRCSG